MRCFFTQSSLNLTNVIMSNFRWKFCLLPLCVFFLNVDVSADHGDDDDIPVGHIELMNLFDKPTRPDEMIVLEGEGGPPTAKKAVQGKQGHKNPPSHRGGLRTKGSQPKHVPQRQEIVTHNTVKIDRGLLAELIKFGREQPFTPIINTHGQLASELITVLLDAPTIEDVMAITQRYEDIINPSLYMYALSVAIMHRNDTRKYPLSEMAKIYPKKFVDSRLIRKAAEVVNLEGSTQPIEIWRNYSTASEREPEHCLAYFREDIGINLHHWHWHIVHPFEGDERVVKKDRRGELFAFMHRQILARYNAERLSNKLPRVKRLNNLREPITEGYFSKMDNHVASASWPPRPSGAILQDLDRPDGKLDLQDLERWTNRLYEAIYSGFMLDKNGDRIPLTEKDGIDFLGNAVEASPVLSPNFDYYGQVHNKGHMAIAFVHDPNGHHMEHYGIMGDSATAMRDPVFYRWHSYIDEIFLEYKKTLNPYTDEELEYPGVEVKSIEVRSEGSTVANRLDTFWAWCDFDLSRGLDFKPNTPVRARFTHLDHKPFEYQIKYKSTLDSEKLGIVRIFLGPKIDERGLPFELKEQSIFMFEMDRFDVTLKPGENVIKRKSNESSLTIPLSTNSRHLNLDVIPTEEEFCGCGWPQHMLVPRGTKEGFPMDLFVMISNDEGDYIEVDQLTGSKAAPIFCGLRNRKYPEARAMGFPFDRKPGKFIDTLPQFLKKNMATREVKIFFTDKIV